MSWGSLKKSPIQQSCSAPDPFLSSKDFHLIQTPLEIVPELEPEETRAEMPYLRTQEIY